MKRISEHRIVAIHGKKQSGKDTIAHIIDTICRRKGRNHMVKIKIANPVKRIACIILDCTLKDLESEEFKSKVLPEKWWKHKILNEDWFYEDISKKEYDNLPKEIKESNNALQIKTTVRHLLQKIGTEFGREILYQDVWLDKFLQFNEKTPHLNLIVTDLRFLNEYKALKSLGAMIIKVIRPTEEKENSHISENALEDTTDWDHVIVNDGSIEELTKKIEKVF